MPEPKKDKAPNDSEVAEALKEEGYADGFSGVLIESIKNKLLNFYYWTGWRAGTEARKRRKAEQSNPD